MIVVLLVGAFVLGSVAEALAFQGHVRFTMAFARSLPGVDVNGFRIWATEATSPASYAWGPQFPPNVKTFPYYWLPKSDLWLMHLPSAAPHSPRGYINTGLNPIYRVVHYGEAWYPLSNWYTYSVAQPTGFFQVTYSLPGNCEKRLDFISAWTQTIGSGVQSTVYGPSVAAVPPTWTWGSQPRISNPAQTLDASENVIANTQEMVVRNIKFAQGGEGVNPEPGDPSLDAVFEASEDATRVGPIVIQPGEEVELSAMPASIDDPDAGGILLVKGEVDDPLGGTVPFVVQWAPEPDPTPTPASSWWSVALAVVVAFGMAVFVRARLVKAS